MQNESEPEAKIVENGVTRARRSFSGRTEGGWPPDAQVPVNNHLFDMGNRNLVAALHIDGLLSQQAARAANSLGPKDGDSRCSP